MLRATRTTFAPAASSTFAKRAPRPELAPVTIAILPSSRKADRGSGVIRGYPS